MKLKDYLSGKTVSLCTAGISGLFLFLAFHFCNVPLPFTVCLLLGESLIIVVGIVMGWRQASSRLQKLKKQLAYGCKQVDEFEDEVNEITKVFAITREEWKRKLMCE